MEFKVELKGLNKALLLLDEKRVRQAASHAINDVSSRVRTASDRAVRRKYALEAGDTKKMISVSLRSKPGTLEAVIQARSTPLSLKHFKTKQVSNLAGGGVAIRTGGRKFDEYRKGSKQQRGLSTKITKDGGYRPVKRGFAMRHSKGGLSYWRRTGPGKWGTMDGLKMIRVITVASMFAQKPVENEINKAIDLHWSKRFEYRMDREFGK